MVPGFDMVDPKEINQEIERARATLRALDKLSTDDELTRLRCEYGRQHCEDLIRQLEALLHRTRPH